MCQPSDDCWSVEMQYLYRCQQYKPYLSLNDKIIRLNIIVIKSFLRVAGWRDLSVSGDLERVNYLTFLHCVFSPRRAVCFQMLNMYVCSISISCACLARFDYREDWGGHLFDFSPVCVSNVKYVPFQNFHRAPAWPDLTMGRIGGVSRKWMRSLTQRPHHRPLSNLDQAFSCVRF